MTNINKNNPEYSKIKSYLTKTFNNFRNSTLNSLIVYMLLNREVTMLDLSTIDGVSKSFIDKNKKRINDDNTLRDEYYQKIRFHIDRYIHLEAREYSSEEASNDNYINATLKEDENGDEYIIPDDIYTYTDFIKNKKENKFITHKINEEITLLPIDYSRTIIQRSVLSFFDTGEMDSLPITFKVECPHPECSNSIKFTENDRLLNIWCAGLGTNEGHNLKITSANMITNEMISLKYYLVEDDEGNNIPGLFLSEKELPYHAEVEYVKITTPHGIKNNLFLVLCHNEKENDNVDYRIINEHGTKYFLEDIFLSLQEYAEKEHQIIITNQNKIVAYIAIFTVLSNMYHKKRFYSQILGFSGGGKSFLLKSVLAMMTNKYNKLNGTQVTKNMVLGGQSEKTGINGAKLVKKGLVGTTDFLLIEEASNQIDEFNSNSNKSSNIYTMVKDTKDEKVSITSQGTFEYESTASIILTGNIDQLKSYEEYPKDLLIEYKKMTNSKQDIDIDMPLFYSLQYYRELDENLAQAHYKIRSELRNKDYITRITPAELSRFDFYILIEDDNEEEKQEKIKNTKISKRTHADQIYEELIEYFPVIDIDSSHDKYEEFFNEIDEYVFFYRNHKPNNFIERVKGSRHYRYTIRSIARSFFLFQKQFYREKYKLTNHDKELFEDFMRYNYNVLSMSDARLETKPYFNNYNGFNRSKSINKIINKQIERDKEQELRSNGSEVTDEQLSSDSADVFTSDEDDIFNIMNDMENI